MAKHFELEKPTSQIDEEDQATLTAIDDGISDANAGRTVPMEKVPKPLSKWISCRC